MSEQYTDGRCFLCSPPPDLIFVETENFVALAGLGPVVDGYSILAAKSHIKSMADVPEELEAERDMFFDLVRKQLAGTFGSCLFTEHGRMAVCADENHDQHCFHAHFLMFPGAEDISLDAASYFGAAANFEGLNAALAHGSACEEYLLISAAH